MSKTYHQIQKGSTPVSGSTVTFSFPVNPTSGRSLLVFVLGYRASGSGYQCTSVTDNAAGGSNVYNQVALVGPFGTSHATANRGYAFLATNITGGALTLTINNVESTNNYINYIALEVSATGALSFDKAGTAYDEWQVATGAGTGPTATASGENVDANALVVGVSYWLNNGSTITATVNSGGYTSLVASDNVTTAYLLNSVCGYKIASGLETSSYQATISNNDSNQGVMVVTLKETGVTISSITSSLYYNSETGIVITGTGFGTSQGNGNVIISPTDDINNASTVNQTVTSWADTSITFTSVRKRFATGTNLYLFVKENGGSSNSSGSIVQFYNPPIIMRWVS